MTDPIPPSSDQTSDTVPAPFRDIIPEGGDHRQRGAQPGNINSLGHGAPVGNTNNLKHGFYSSAFTRAERKRLDEDLQGELKDEEECIRLIVRRFLDSMGDEKKFYRCLLAVRTISPAIGRLESLHRTRRVIYDKQTTLDQVWEELKLIPPEED